MFENNRILIVDDNPSIHQDFKNSLLSISSSNEKNISNLQKEIFGESTQLKNQIDTPELYLIHAFNTEEALNLMIEYSNRDLQIALVFMDIRMPPGRDGIEASRIILEKFPNTEIVLCSAFTEYTNADITNKLGITDHILFLKKPFDVVEVRQISFALLSKWNTNSKFLNYMNRLEFEVKERTKNLQDAYTEVKKSEQAKSNFLTLMSHEIRNPINSIMGLLELVRSNKDATLKDQYIDLAFKSTSHLLDLINDVLDLSKIDANRLILNENKLDLPALMDELLDAFSMNVNKKGLEMIALYPLFLPKEIFGDASRIKQILTNFIANATKFTLEGSIKIKLTTKRISQDKIKVTFEVIDTGIGISAKDQKKLFIDYMQIQSGLPYNMKGTGLGLSITKKLANLMSGDVGVKSEKSKGSSFWLEMTLACQGPEKPVFNIPDLKKTQVIICCKTQAILEYFEFIQVALKSSVTFLFLSPEKPINEIFQKLKGMQKIHLFYDFDFPLSVLEQNNLAEVCKTVTMHPIAGIGMDPKIKISENVELKPFYRPLHFVNFYSLIGNKAESKVRNKDTEILQKTMVIEKWKNQFKILVVDDDPMALLISSTNLKNFGFLVDQAESGELAVEFHKKYQYDLIFMDLMLNGSNGIETTKKIRQMPNALSSVRVFALTANAFAEDKERCLAGGMDGFLIKPITTETLIETVKNEILRKFKEKKNKDSDRIQAVKKASVVIPDELLNNDKTLCQMVSIFFKEVHKFNDEQLQQMLVVCKNSIDEALSLIEPLLPDKDLNKLKIHFHRLKGSFKNIGLNDLAEIAKKTELEIINENKSTTAQYSYMLIKSVVDKNWM